MQDNPINTALEVQKDQLKSWYEVLNQNAYDKLVTWVKLKNKTAKIPDDIPRGVNLSKFIHQIYLQKRQILTDKINMLHNIVANAIDKHPSLSNKIHEIASISYDNTNYDTDISDCIVAMNKVQELVSEYEQNMNNNQLSR